MANEADVAKPISSTDVDWVTPEGGVFEVYANVFVPQWTLSDVRIRLGQFLAKGKPFGPKGFVIVENAALTITWRDAKNLRDVLIKVIENYEKVNGELKPIILPPAIP